MALRNRTIATIAIIVSLIVIVAGFIASEMNDYSTVQTFDGVAYVKTADGLVKLKKAIDGAEDYKVTTVNFKLTVDAPHVNPANVPSKLPNTSAPHGVNTCTMIDSNSGATFTVTTDQDCATLN